MSEPKQAEALCPDCDGSGLVYDPTDNRPDWPPPSQIRCEACGGTGRAGKKNLRTPSTH